MFAKDYLNCKNNLELQYTNSQLEAIMHFFQYYYFKLDVDPPKSGTVIAGSSKARRTVCPSDFNLKPILDLINKPENSQLLILRATVRSKDRAAEVREFLQKVKTVLRDEPIKNFFVIYSAEGIDDVFANFRSELDFIRENSLLWTQDCEDRFPIIYAMMMK